MKNSSSSKPSFIYSIILQPSIFSEIKTLILKKITCFRILSNLSKVTYIGSLPDKDGNRKMSHIAVYHVK